MSSDYWFKNIKYSSLPKTLHRLFLDKIIDGTKQFKYWDKSTYKFEPFPEKQTNSINSILDYILQKLVDKQLLIKTFVPGLVYKCVQCTSKTLKCKCFTKMFYE